MNAAEQVAAECPLCGAQVYLTREFCIPVEDGTNATSASDPAAAISEGWEVICENFHRLDSGSPETDGRSARVGHRRALVLGGLR